MSTPIALCADDYGLAPGVSRAILDLIERGRITATDCMTVSPYWPEHARWLRPLADRADIGLHLTLTDQRPLGPMPRLAPGGRLPPVGTLIRLAHTGRLHAPEIEAEIDRQMDAFETHFGAPPAFVDGHQHVHQLPLVREALSRRLAGRPIWVRLCREPVPRIVRRGVAIPKALLIAALGRGLARRARLQNQPANTGFSGVYDLSVRVPYGRLFERFLLGLRAGGLIMCHPGVPDEALRALDPMTEARQAEYDWLRGPAFPDLLERRGMRLVRLSQWRA